MLNFHLLIKRVTNVLSSAVDRWTLWVMFYLGVSDKSDSLMKRKMFFPLPPHDRLPLCFSADTNLRDLLASWCTCLHFSIFNEKFFYARKQLHECLLHKKYLFVIPSPIIHMHIFDYFYSICVQRNVLNQPLEHNSMFGVSQLIYIILVVCITQTLEKYNTYWCTQTYPFNMQKINKL